MKRTINDYFLKTGSKSPQNVEVEINKRQKLDHETLQGNMQKVCRSLPGVLVQSLKPSWFHFMSNEFDKEYFKSLDKYLLSERQRYTIFPERDNVWSWTCVSPDQVKVVILGQDPYHNPKQAHGLAFSVQKPGLPPPSLVNIYKELKNDYPGFITPNHGCLQGWADQGVLLLNTTLTVRSNQPMSHANAGWETFTDAVIKKLSVSYKNLVFILWGRHAQTKLPLIDCVKHLCLRSVHPSPLSVSKGFFGCKHFTKCNSYLKLHSKEIIRWDHLP